MKEKPDLADRIVLSLDAILGLEGETAGPEEHKALLEAMAGIVRTEINNWMFGE